MRNLQAAAYANKVAKGFNVTEVPLEFCYLHSELAEAFEAYRQGLPTIGEELADVAIYLLGLAEILQVDLEAAIRAKMATNATRTYRTVDGLSVRVDEGEAERAEGAERGGEGG